MPYESESDARIAAEAILLSGWGIHVWENMGWHFRLTRGPMCICQHESGSGYFAMISSNLHESGRGYGPWTKILPPSPTPATAINDAAEAFAERMEGFMAIAAAVHDALVEIPPESS